MPESRHFVVIIGGAVSGSVAAEILAEAGMEIAVIEQNDRPYGKIEDGLPRWHVHQRQKEYEKINGRLKGTGISFVPRTKLGRDINFKDLTENWGASAVLLANGAWRDRPQRLEGAEDLLGRGFEYQNPFIYWFNHQHETGFSDRQIEVPDGAVILGGGLASIDCVKVCQIVNYQRAFQERGIEVDPVEIEKKGVAKLCEAHGIADPAELGVKGCTLVYRRRIQDMPLAQPAENATPEQMEKTFAARRKLLEIAQKKLLFHIQDQTLPTAFITRDGRVAGLKLVRTKVEGRKATPIPDSEHNLETALVISSIGSIPEKIPGVEMNGEVFAFKDWDLGVYDAEKGIFGVGNVVTGQGNIRKSLLHAQKVAAHLKDSYFRGALGAASAEAVKEHLAAKDPLPPDQVQRLRQRIQELQERVKYDDYEAWIKRVT